MNHFSIEKGKHYWDVGRVQYDTGDYDDDLVPSGDSVSNVLTDTAQSVSVRKYFPEAFLWEFVDVDGLVFAIRSNCKRMRCRIT